MNEGFDLLDDLQSSLSPYIKSREQVNYIRRILALHLAECSGQASLRPPLSLAKDDNSKIHVAPELRGLSKEYMEALSANRAARKRYADAVASSSGTQLLTTIQPASNADALQQHIAFLRLQEKKENLLAVQESLEELLDKPAASDEYLDLDRMFEGTAQLPAVPKDLLNTMVTEQVRTTVDIQNRISQLEKVVLRAKLLLKQEEQHLGQARANASRIPQPVRSEVKMDALSIARNELIAWIETELGKTTEESSGEQPAANQRSRADNTTVSKQLDSIQEKYALYVSSRKSLLDMLSQSQSTGNQSTALTAPSTSRQPAKQDLPITSDHLLIPYLKALMSASQIQKDLVATKAHVSATISKRTKELDQRLGELAQDSDLVNDKIVRDRRRSSTLDISSHGNRQGTIDTKVQPWIEAADAIKITHLESLATDIESGQTALEKSAQALNQLRHLTGQDSHETTTLVDNDAAWAGAAQDLPKTYKSTDMWSKIHGSLGLLGHD